MESWKWSPGNDLQVKNGGLLHPNQRRRPLQQVWLKMSSTQVLGGSNTRTKFRILFTARWTCITHNNLLLGLFPVGIDSGNKPPSDTKV